MNRRTRLFLMIGLSAAAVAIGASAMAFAEPEVKKAKLGKKAPEFTLLDTSGQERSLSDYKGKTVVLEWFNLGCPFVQRCYESKAMQDAYMKSKQWDKGIAWLAVNSTYTTTAEQNDAWMKSYKLKYPILLDTDGKVARLYDARRTPHMFVIDKEGILRYHGAIDDNRLASKSADEVTNFVVNAVQQLVEEETVTPDYVKPYGCSIKYKP